MKNQMPTPCLSTTVTLDYDRVAELFVSSRERCEFSAERIIAMLNEQIQVRQAHLHENGRLHIVVEEGRCIITQTAMAMLSQAYEQGQGWDIDYPFVAELFPTQAIAQSA